MKVKARCVVTGYATAIKGFQQRVGDGIGIQDTALLLGTLVWKCTGVESEGRHPRSSLCTT
jgi:hypothetical protein